MIDIEEVEDLLGYLRSTARIRSTEIPRIQLLKGGVSNRTVLVERSSGEAWVLKQALEKLRVPVEWLSDPSRIRQEALALEWLPELIPHESLTPLIFKDFEQNLFAMEAVSRPHSNWKEMLLQGEIQEPHVASFALILAQLHSRSHEKREVFEEIFGEDCYFESLRLEPYFTYSAQVLPRAASFLNELVDLNRQRNLTLVHGDFSPKNILIQKNRLILLDHEVIHFGDPAFDVGFAATHLLSKGHFLKSKRDNFWSSAIDFSRIYFDEVKTRSFSDRLEKVSVFNCLGCLLARAVGRSQLEYLDDSFKERQVEIVLRILRDPPREFEALIDRFFNLLD